MIQLNNVNGTASGHGVVINSVGNKAIINGGSYTGGGIVLATDGGGYLEANNTIVYGNNNLGTSNFAAIKVQSSNDAMNLNNVEIHTINSSGIEVAYGSAVLTNCLAYVKEPNVYLSTAYAVSNGGSLTLNNSQCESAGYGLYVFNSGGTIEVNGGSYNASEVLKLDNEGEGALSSSNISVNSGIFTGNIPTQPNVDNNSLHISGGEFSNDPSLFVNESIALASLTSGDTTVYGVNESYIRNLYDRASSDDTLHVINGNITLEKEKPGVNIVLDENCSVSFLNSIESSSSSVDSSHSYDTRDKNRDGVVTCDEAMGEGWIWSEYENACVLESTSSHSSQSSSEYQLVNTVDR